MRLQWGWGNGDIKCLVFRFRDPLIAHLFTITLLEGDKVLTITRIANWGGEANCPPPYPDRGLSSKTVELAGNGSKDKVLTITGITL